MNFDFTLDLEKEEVFGLRMISEDCGFPMEDVIRCFIREGIERHLDMVSEHNDLAAEGLAGYLVMLGRKGGTQ